MRIHFFNRTAAVLALFVGFATSAMADPCGMVPPVYIDDATPIARVGDQNTYVFFKDGIETFVIRPGFTGKVEEFGMLILDTRNRLKKLEIISKGSVNGSLVHPREVYREAVTLQAAGLILFHNHPSGDPTPSPHDVALTRRLVSVGRAVGIPILDHIVIGRNAYSSLRDLGLLSE